MYSMGFPHHSGRLPLDARRPDLGHSLAFVRILRAMISASRILLQTRRLGFGRRHAKRSSSHDFVGLKKPLESASIQLGPDRVDVTMPSLVRQRGARVGSPRAL